MQKCDILRYSVSEVSEGWQLLIDGIADPDPDRRADLWRAYTRLPAEERYILVARGQGWTYSDIARFRGRGNHPQTGKRLVDRAFAHLRGVMNG